MVEWFSDCSPVQYQQLPDIAEEGIYDVAQPNVPKIIWTYWENIHQAIRTLIVTGCFGLSLVRPVGRMGRFSDEKNSKNVWGRRGSLLLLGTAKIKVYKQSCLACAVFVSFRSFICISIYHCLLQQTSNGSSRKEMYFHIYIHTYVCFYMYKNTSVE